MNITDITEQAGAHKRRKRVGRGTGSGHGKTSGRGHKGLGQRSGGTSRRLFEGGASPLFMRLPKVGFNNFRYARNFYIVNVRDLQRVFKDGAKVTRESLISARLVPDGKLPIKILGDGELSVKLQVEAQKFSVKAAERITACGGQANVVAKK